MVKNFFGKNKSIFKARKDKLWTVDKFVKFLDMFNKFINHRPKRKEKMIDRDMRM